MRSAPAAALLGLAAAVLLAPAQEPAPPAAEAEYKPDPAMVRLRAQVNPELPAWSPEYVVERCAEHLATINRRDHARIRYFSLADVPLNKLPAAVGALHFVANSTARIPVSVVPRPVPDTDNRIFWIDLAWFNWRPETWESLCKEDPYFLEPIVPSDAAGLGYLRRETGGNAVMRGDWFTHYAMDNGEFLNGSDATAEFNENSFYYQLLYSNVEFTRAGKKVRGVGPATAAEFEESWYVDFSALADFPIDKGVMVDKGFSGVALGNRIMWRVRGRVGTYWRTFDVFRVAGDQDFIETPFPKKFNAGEHIFQDERGAQYYHLSNGAGKSVDYANPFVVKGDPANVHNSVLVTSRSCVHCHDAGIQPFRSEPQRLRAEGLQLKAYDYAMAERYNQFYLQEQKMARLLKADQDNYSAFVLEVNGLSAAENVQGFVAARTQYLKDVTLDQAARELGATTQEFSDALAYGVGTPDKPEGVTKGRLGRLVLTGQPLPRHTWERGLYQEAGLLLMEHRKAAKMRVQGQDRPHH